MSDKQKVNNIVNFFKKENSISKSNKKKKDITKDSSNKDVIEIIDIQENDTNTIEKKNIKSKTKSKKELDRIELNKKKKELEKKKKDLERLKEKERKENERIKLKMKKDEEKRKKEEERLELKKQKELERLELKKKKEEERLKEKKRKEDEKRKELERIELEKQKELERIEKSQTKIGNFFKKKIINDDLKIKNINNSFLYPNYFKPFYCKDNVSFINISNKYHNIQNNIDSLLKESIPTSSNWLSSLHNKRGYDIQFTAVKLLQQMTSKDKTDIELQKLLSLIPHKYIKFYENIRPPYIGTYSKEIILPIDNPFTTTGTSYNYDYDSDLEWVNEESDEGDIDNLESGDDDDDEDDEDVESEGEFDGFLDQDDSSNKKNKKKKIIGPLIPNLLNKLDNSNNLDIDDITYFNKLSAISFDIQISLPIDPNFIPETTTIIKSSNLKRSLPDSSSLEDISNNSSTTTTTASPSPEKKPKIIITDNTDLLILFNQVQGSTFSLATLTEIVQTKVPNYNKQIIKNTIKYFASRSTGAGNTPKVWDINDKDNWQNITTNSNNN